MNLDRIAALHPTFDETTGVLSLDLHHGKANEMGSQQLAALEELCALLESDEGGGVRLLCTLSHRTTSKGTPIFISGANVTERVGWSDEQVKAHVKRQRALMQRLRHLPLVTVALTHGVTFGWGAEFLLTADVVLATPGARIALPETGLGILPGARGTAELSAIVGTGHAMLLGAVGEELDAAGALRLGLVHEVVETLDAGVARAVQMASSLAKRSPTAVAAFKAGLLAVQGQPEAARLELESRCYEHCVDTGEAAIGRGAFDAIRAGAPVPWGPRRPPRADASRRM